MVERFTESARQVMPLAVEESDRLGHHYLGCEHLLAGLARQTGSAAGQLLAQHGLDVAIIRRELDLLVRRGVLPPPGYSGHELLGRLGVDLNTVLLNMERAFGPDAVRDAVDRAGGGDWILLRGRTLEVKQAFWLAGKQAEKSGHTGICAEDLLIGVLIDAQNPIDRPRCFQNAWQRGRRARLGLPQRGPSPVRLLVEQRGMSLRALRRAVVADLLAR